MERQEHYAVKVIVFLGAFVFLLLFFSAQLLQKQLKPDLRQRVQVDIQRSPFNRERAAKDLESILSGAGPRPAGSPGVEIARGYLRKEAQRAGFALSEYPFETAAPSGKVACASLMVRVRGTLPGVILVGTPLDTPVVDGKPILGANAAGAGTAWLLEMARMLGSHRSGRSLWLVWYDGTQTPGKGREFVELLRASGELGQVEAVINVAEIGDCFLSVASDPLAPSWLRDCVWGMARDLVYDRHFSEAGPAAAAVEPSFRACGMPCLDLVDYPFGGTVVQHRELWHSAQDTADRVCPESLQAIADVLYYSLVPLEAQLDVLARERVR